MDNFVHEIKTKVYFGEGQLDHLAKELKIFGKKVLLVYGGGSIKRNGVYDTVINECKKEGLEVFELSGVEPNPRSTTARKGVEICRKENIDVILAAGGGSTIDCSKAIAAGTFYDGDVWDMVLNRGKGITKTLPIVTILTMAATGSEMNNGAVISNWETNDKIGFATPLNRPKVTFEDPTITYTLNAYQTAAGVVDIMSHVMEQYFCKERNYMANRMAEAILKTCIHYGPIAVNEPTNYDARANIMWASSWALNGLLSEGKSVGWSVHAMEHELSAYYDITHGIGLAILTPRWMQHVLSDDTLDVFVEFGVNVWGIDAKLEKEEIAKQAIQKTYDFFKSLKIPMTLQEVEITSKENFDIMAEKAAKGFANTFVEMNSNDVKEIYEASFQD